MENSTQQATWSETLIWPLIVSVLAGIIVLIVQYGVIERIFGIAAPTPTAIPIKPTFTPTSIPPTNTPAPQSTATPVPTATFTPIPGPRVIAKTDDVNIRSGPGLAYATPIGTLSSGESADIIGVHYDWWQIRLDNGTPGWVYKDVVTTTGAITNVATSTDFPPLPTSAPTPIPTATQMIAFQTCAEIRTQNPNAGDGEYKFYLNGDVNKPFSIYCYNMSVAPTEYLTLPNQGGTFNFSRFAHGGSATGSDMTTHFNKLRINPLTLEVTLNDFIFAKTEGDYQPVPGRNVPDIDDNPYGRAWSCIAARDQSGRGNINLVGTPFAIDRSVQFEKTGYLPAGSETFSQDRKVVNFDGGGYCGSYLIRYLRLVYVGPS